LLGLCFREEELAIRRLKLRAFKVLKFAGDSAAPYLSHGYGGCRHVDAARETITTRSKYSTMAIIDLIKMLRGQEAKDAEAASSLPPSIKQLLCNFLMGITLGLAVAVADWRFTSRSGPA
jgi:hypothetical protein